MVQSIDHSTPFLKSGKRPEKMMQPNAKVLSTSCRKTCHCCVLVRENSHKGQNGKATVFCCCVMPFSWFLFCHVEHRHLTTCTKACQTISGLVRKTCGRLIIPRHAIGWNLRVSALTDRSGVVYYGGGWRKDVNQCLEFDSEDVFQCALCWHIHISVHYVLYTHTCILKPFEEQTNGAKSGYCLVVVQSPTLEEKNCHYAFMFSPFVYLE